jgi:hypothetical protein
VLEVFRCTLNRQGFLIKGLIPDLMVPLGKPFVVFSFRINLPDPPGISVAGRPDQDILREVSKKVILCFPLKRFRHEFILS